MKGSNLIALRQEFVPFSVHHGVPTINLGTGKFQVRMFAERSTTKQNEDF
jgi:hypothetical protein